MLVLLVSQGKSLSEVAKLMGCGKATVFYWNKRFVGGKSLTRSPGSGRPRKLTSLEQRDVILAAKRDPHITADEIRQKLGREDVCITTKLAMKLSKNEI